MDFVAALHRTGSAQVGRQEILAVRGESLTRLERLSLASFGDLVAKKLGLASTGWIDPVDRHRGIVYPFQPFEGTIPFPSRSVTC